MNEDLSLKIQELEKQLGKQQRSQAVVTDTGRFNIKLAFTRMTVKSKRW